MTNGIMRRRVLRSMSVLLASCLHATMSSSQSPTPAAQFGRETVLRNVNEALSASKVVGFAQARAGLDRSLSGCPSGPSGQDCRTLYASGLGSLLQQQATVDKRQREALYAAAVSYYDRILAEVPNHSEALYGKAVAYRALGAREWMASFFDRAPALDPARAALYFTFQGDYYADVGNSSAAARAYTQATLQDPDDDGARNGLVDALAAQGPAARPELLRRAVSWELRYPASAAAAYRGALAASFAPTGRRDAIADSAIVGLVSVQARNRLALGDVPAGVSADWTPLREIRSFVASARSQSAVWWKAGHARRTALAQTALAAGRAAVSARRYDVAEQLWREGVEVARFSSLGVTLDLQRELALLYFHQSSLDPDRRKFEALEQQIFEGKGPALAAGDLEAAQRYHTALGLIYVQRGVWNSRNFAHSAEQQLTWALDKAQTRQREQRFYQPLPELRVLLARGLDSTGKRERAGAIYADAAKAFLDVDDLSAADTASGHANRLGANITETAKVLAVRSELAQGEAAATLCSGVRLAELRTMRDVAFGLRQRFKVEADCARAAAPSARRQHAIDAFNLVDSADVALVGGADVARFERVLQALLTPFGVAMNAAQLDVSPLANGPRIQVSLPAEISPLWYAVSQDAMIAGRVVAALGSTIVPFPLDVTAGILTVTATAGVPVSRLMQLKGKGGVKDVQVRTRSY